jgi:hypothetical protein
MAGSLPAVRISTLTRYPGVAPAVWNQKVCSPLASSRAVFSRSPAGKCATTTIRAFAVVKTMMPTVLPMMGWLRITDAVDVSGVCVGVAAALVVGVGEGVAVVAEEDAA